MGNAPSHPPLIALNGGSLGRHNTVLVPAEALAGKGTWSGAKKTRRGKEKRDLNMDFPVYTPVVQEAGGFGFGYGPGRRRRARRRGELGVRGGGGTGAGMVYAPVPVPMVYPYDPRGAAEGLQFQQALGGYVPVPVHIPVSTAARKGILKTGARHMGGAQAGGGGGRRYTHAPMFAEDVVPGIGTGTGVAGPSASPYAGQRVAQGRVPPQMQQKRQPPHPTGVAAVAQGVHFARPPAHAPQGRSPPASKGVGASGDEWMSSDKEHLDVCTCTTECKCRKGTRVLFWQTSRGEGPGEGLDKRSGEIRYVLKDEMGRGCGDHEEHEEREQRGKKAKEKEKVKEVEGEVGRMCKEMKGLREDIRKMRLGTATLPPAMNAPRMPSHGGWPMVNDADMHPRMAQHMGAADPYDLPPRMMSGRQPRMSMPMSSRPTGGDPADDFSYDAEDMFNPGVPPNMPYPPPPHLRPSGPRRAKQRRGPPGRVPRRPPDFDPELEYAPRPARRGLSMPMHVPRQRGGAGERPGRHAPPPPPPAEYIDLKDSGADSGGRFGPGRADEDWAGGMHDEYDMPPPPLPPPVPGQSPRSRGRGSGSGSGSGERMDGRRAYQARVEDGDEF